MGRSRGGLTTKIHALVDANGLPITIKLTEGQAHDGSSAADMLGGLKAGQSCSPTAPTTAMRCATP
jgi:transposase